MKCPTPCYCCNQIVELHDLCFYSGIVCDCQADGECEHGICDECIEEYVQKNTGDEDE